MGDLLWRPPRVGERVGVCAPSGPADEARLARGLSALAAFGVEVVELPQARRRDRYLAGGDDERAAALNALVRDPSIRAIASARGGYGALRMASALDVAALRADPKPLLAFSDATVLHGAWARAGVASVHGPVLTQLGEQPPESLARARAALFGEPLAPLTGLATVASGEATGPLHGGNLATLASMVGTPWLPALRGAILLLEDVGERPYRLDRLFTQLRVSGALDGVAGVVLGDFTDCDEPAKPGVAAYRGVDVLAALCASLGVPAVSGAHVGHGDVNLSVPLGRAARLDATAGVLSFGEAFR